LDKLANLIIKYEEFPKLNFAGIMQIIEILYRRFKNKAEHEFYLKNSLFDIILLLSFPFPDFSSIFYNFTNVSRIK